MDYNQNISPNQQQQNTPYYQQEAPRNTFTNCALGFALASVFSIMTIYLPLIFGSLAIVFAILSKRERLKFNMTEILAVGLSLFSIVVVIATMFAAVYIVISNPQYIIDSIEMMSPFLEQTYGVTSEEIIQQLESILPVLE